MVDENNMASFVGRKEELKLLRELSSKKAATFAVIRGRRRIGKSRLVEEFAKQYTFYKFTGLPPTSGEKTTAASQREAFAKKLQKYFNIPIKSDDWWDLLWFLSEQTKQGRVVILFDEISWLGSNDPNFLGKIKTVWDDHFSKNPQLIFILCGSISSWIDKNILSSTGFVGRVSFILTLKELDLRECSQFLTSGNDGMSAYEKFKILSITGGVPRYLEEINPHFTAEKNITKLCFTESGTLFNDFDQLFSDCFDSRSVVYKKIVMHLASGSDTRQGIAQYLNLQIGGVISEYLDDLCTSGFISRDFSWNIKDGKTSKLSYYRLSDNYLRFYLKYILPNKNKILAGAFANYALNSFPGWSSIMGLQFENLVLANRKIIKRLLEIKPEENIADGAYFQRQTARHQGCQIDYLVQTSFNHLYICEIKFSQHEIKSDIIDEMQEKMKRLKLPRNFSYRPVLIHVNGVCDQVREKNYFAKIIDFAELLGG